MVRLPSEDEITTLLDKANLKYQLIILLMADAGLRVTEVVRLQVKHFDFQSRLVKIHSLKKRGEDKVRSIPLTERTFSALACYWPKLKDKSSEAYLFPASSQSKQPHLSRKVVYRRINAYSSGSIHPHMLRHFFASRIVNSGNDIRTAQALLGHASQNTTEIYLHVPEQQMQQAIQSIQAKPGLIQSFFSAWFGSKEVSSIPVQRGMTAFHIGREKEMADLNTLAQKKVNTLILGPMGIGKSHILDNFNLGKIIRIDDFRYPKKVLASLLLELFDGDKEAIMQLLLSVEVKAEVEKIATKESAKRLSELAIQVTQPQEYTLIIDDLTDVTKLGVRILEKLKNHFHIIAAARRIKVEQASFLSNFEKLDLKPLSRAESIELVSRLIQPFLSRVQDFEALKNRIWEDTEGNPLYIIEMVERLSKESTISVYSTEQIRHTASKQEIDFSIPLVIGISSLFVLRYLGSELGQNAGAFRLLGGMALVLSFFSRRIFRVLKRKFI